MAGKSDQDLIAHIQQCEKEYHYLRYGHERDWYRNLLYRQGHQWIVWDGTGRHFRQKKLKSWIPTPCTNKFRSVLDALSALILRVEPDLQWRALDPNDEPEKTKAETATQIVERIKESTHFREWRQMLANWIVYTGNGYLANFYDAAGGGSYDIPLMCCQVCQCEGVPSQFEEGCPNCGVSGHNDDGSPKINYAFGEDGIPKNETFKAGAIRTEIASPFETYSDWTVTQWVSQSEALIIKSRPLTYFKRQYKKNGDKVQAGQSITMTEYYSNALAYMGSGAGLSPTYGKGGRPHASEYWYVRMPDDDYPEGCYAIMGGDVLLEKDTLTCRDHNGNRFLPITQLIMDPIPGSGIGTTPANDLAPKQAQRNRLESLIELITMRSANPVWIVPFGTDVEGFSGQPGAVLKSIQISSTASGDPKRLPGENIPSSLMQWLDKIDNDMEELASVFDLLKGNQPPGVTAGYALQLLTERGQSRWGPLFQRWENGMIMWAVQTTALTREYASSAQLVRMLGPHGEWEVDRFKEEPMTTLTMRCEAGSSKPTSSLTEQAILDNLIAKGLVDITDPANKAQILRSVGMSKYDNQSDYDMKDAAKEEQAFLLIAQAYDLPGLVQKVNAMQQSAMDNQNPMAMQQATQESQQAQAEVQTLTMSALRFRPQIDNHVIHIWAHKKFAKSDAFMRLPAEWQAIFMKHVEEHGMAVMKEQLQMQMAQGGGMQPPTGPPPEGPGGPSAGGPPPQAGGTMEPSFEAASAKGGHKQRMVGAGAG